MKVISYNLNGLRAATKLNVLDWIKQEDADLICLQEVRAEQEICEEILKEVNGYNVIYNCGEKKGYSGTITLSKLKPREIQLGLSAFQKDIEGRTIITTFDDFTVINSYIPNGSTRLAYKMNFVKELIDFMNELLINHKKIILCCDANIAHNEIDVNKPKAVFKKSGFLPEERKLMDKLLKKDFFDSFRKLNPELVQYTWRSYRARKENNDFGWRYRFDYIICSKALEKEIKKCYSPDLEYSDHLPVILEVK